MRYMFSGCINLKNLDLSKFNTKNVINMEGMFGQYNNISPLDLSSLELIENIEEIQNYKTNIKKEIYLEGCKNIEYLNLSSFNTQNVTNMEKMFFNYNNLKELNLPSSFNTQNVTNMMRM